MMVTKHSHPLKNTLIAIAAFIVIGYGIFSARHLLTGPQITIFSPEADSLQEEPLISIKGQVRNSNYISLNDKPIMMDERGNFEEKLLLSPGPAIISMYARDRFGRETRTQIRVVHEGEGTFALYKAQEKTLRSGGTTDIATSTASTSLSQAPIEVSIATTTPTF